MSIQVPKQISPHLSNNDQTDGWPGLFQELENDLEERIIEAEVKRLKQTKRQRAEGGGRTPALPK